MIPRKVRHLRAPTSPVPLKTGTWISTGHAPTTRLPTTTPVETHLTLAGDPIIHRAQARTTPMVIAVVHHRSNECRIARSNTQKGEPHYQIQIEAARPKHQSRRACPSPAAHLELRRRHPHHAQPVTTPDASSTAVPGHRSMPHAHIQSRVFSHAHRPCRGHDGSSSRGRRPNTPPSARSRRQAPHASPAISPS